VLSREYADQLEAVGLAAGLDRVGLARADPFLDARQALTERAAAGLAATMQFTYRNPERSTEPARTLATVQTLVVGARHYRGAPRAARPSTGVPARVASYAAADHYGALRGGLEAMATALVDDGWQARVVLDDNALVDRAAARRAGLGWFGKNANILVPGLGSWVVLGSVLTDADLPIGGEPVADGCGACRRCIDACPTQAIVAPGVVDARRCLAWLVQAEGVFPVEHREALGDRLYGCDECQEVCPPSRPRAADGEPVAGARPTETRRAESGPAEDADGGPGDWVDVVALLEADDATLLERYGRWYIPRRDPRYLRRNALVVLANTTGVVSERVRSVLRRTLADPDALVRAHAVWAARRLGQVDLLDAVVADAEAAVRVELDRPDGEIRTGVGPRPR
jgi:epoxyqueuosine reductase